MAQKDEAKSDQGVASAALNAAIQAGLLDKLITLFMNIFRPKPPKPVPPQVHVEAPKPSGGGTDDFPDDVIPRPVGRTIAKVTLNLVRGQYSRERFPNEYTEANPFGLIPDAELKRIMRGESALPWLSKFWLDLTAYDSDNHEFVRADVLAHGFAFKTTHRCGDTFIQGIGADANGNPIAGYQTNDTDQVGNGISAWLSSKGFLHQMQAFGAADGQEFRCAGSVNGVSSNEFTIKVS